MKSKLVLALCLVTAATHAGDSMTIARHGTQPASKGPDQYFTGVVTVEPLYQPKAPARYSAAYVTFEPGARSAWHSHPLGQTLVVTAGSGWVQEEGGDYRIARGYQRSLDGESYRCAIRPLTSARCS
jgi:hypothetical protein